MAASTSTLTPYTGAVTVSHTAPTKIYHSKEGGGPNLPTSIAVIVPSTAAHAVYVCNHDDTDLTRGYPVAVGAQISFDLIAGEELWMIADTADVEVRYVRSGAQ